MVRVTVQLVGSSRKELLLPDEGCSVDQLRARISHAFNCPNSALKLVHKGMALTEGDQSTVKLSNGDTVLAMPQRKAPPAHIVTAAMSARAGGGGHADEEEDEADEPARLPAGAPVWEVRCIELLRARRCPPWVMEWVILIRPRRVIWLLLFLVGCTVASRLSLGPVFILGVMLWLIFTNLGQRKEGDVSAYSICNTGVQRLPGQLDADQIDQQIRRGQM